MGWKYAAALLTLTFFGMGSLVYLLFRRDYDEPDCFFLNGTKICTLEIKIPIESIGIVIGRGGNTIKEIESKSSSKIHIKDENNAVADYKICIIKGTPEATQYAQSLIHELIISQPLITTHETYIPAQACKAVIGKNGDNIRLISRNSNAKIVIENAHGSEVSLERKILIKGTAEQITAAKYLIDQKVEEYFEFCKSIENQLSQRPSRNKTKYLLPAKGEHAEKEEHFSRKQKFTPTSSDGLLEVYVSAIESPNQFWIQMMGPCTVELDKLVDQMTAYYSDNVKREKHKLKEVKIGQIVAAPFAYDNKWYRAEVQEIFNDSEVEESDVLIHYVDYGDSSKCKKNSVYELRTDFLRLRFQAIECALAKVKPTSSCWTEEATDFLEDLTHVALWKSVLAKIHSYTNRSSGLKRQGSPLPCVEIYDIQGDKTIDVAEEMVQKGYAIWDKKEESSAVFMAEDGHLK